MKLALHYEKIYYPLANWNSIRTLMVMTSLHGWHTKKIDYDLAYPQVRPEKEIYMRIPKGFKVVDAYTKEYVLKLHRNICKQKQPGRVCN